jgi:hypothetical protein
MDHFRQSVDHHTHLGPMMIQNIAPIISRQTIFSHHLACLESLLWIQRQNFHLSRL